MLRRDAPTDDAANRSAIAADGALVLAELARRARDRGALDPRVVTALRLIADAVGVTHEALIEAAQAALADVAP